MTRIPQKDIRPFPIRLSEDMRARIQKAADANMRSLNSEIALALEAAFPAPVEPESPNEALRQAAQEVMGGWEAVLRAMGQEPEKNPAYAALWAKLHEATNG